MGSSPQQLLPTACDLVALGIHVGKNMANGTWSASPPSCVANLCPDVSVGHGHVTQEGRVPGDVASVSCDLGYVLRGPARLVCQLSLDWSPGPHPACEPVNCGNPPEVEHAMAHADGFSFMNRANYSCLPGYEKRVSFKIMILNTGITVRSRETRC